MEKIFHGSSYQKESRRNGYTNNGQNRLKLKNVTQDKGCYMLIKGSIQQEDMTIVNIYALNERPSKSTKQKLIEPKREVYDSAVFGGFTIPSSLHLDESTSLQRLPVKRVMRQVFKNNVKFQKIRLLRDDALDA